MTTIHINALQQGDIVITYSGSGTNDRPMLDGSARQAIHAEIVTSVEPALNRAKFVHQANLGLKGTWENDLIPQRAAALSPQDAKLDNMHRVVRCRKDGLAQRAARLARQFSLYQTPYGQNRVGQAAGHQSSFNGDAAALVGAHRHLFEKSGKYRAIKYAARRSGWLCYPDESKAQDGMDTVKGGMFCTTFVVLCYQIAGLEPLVDAADPTNRNLRISDKKMSAKDIAAFGKRYKGQIIDVGRYRTYTEHLKAADPYALGVSLLGKSEIEGRRNYKPAKAKNVEYLPSIAFWRTDKQSCIEACDWASYITAGMMVDAKLIHTQGLYESLVSDGAGWEDMGYLIGRQDDYIQHYSETREARVEREAKMKQQVAAARAAFALRK